MNEQVLGQIRDLLTTTDSAGIVVGRNSSVDSMGAALALYLSLQSSGKNTLISSATTPLVEHSNLIGIDKVKGSFEGEGGDLMVSFPYREGEIDKVSYTLEEGFLNIIVKPGELGLNFSESDVVYRRKGAYPQVIFTVGVQRISDLSSVFDINSLKDTKIVNIDNSVENQSFGDVLVIDTQASSVSEIVANLISNLGLGMDMDVAQNLLDALLSATNNFQDPGTSASAFSLAANLMQTGAKRHAVTAARMEAPKQEAGDVLEMLNQMQREPKSQSQNPSQNLGQGQPRRDRSRNFPQRRFEQRNQNQQRQNFDQQNQRPQQNPSMNSGQSQPQNFNEDQGQDQPDLNNPPEDWLTPKVYKGSTNV